MVADVATAENRRPARHMAAGLMALGAYAATWAVSVLYLRAHGADWTFPLISMGVFGLTLSGVAWLLTRGANVTPPDVRRPGAELGVLAIFLLVYAVVFLGWGLGAVRDAIPAGRLQDVAIIAVKLLAHVALPALLIAFVGGRVAPMLANRIPAVVFWRTLLVLAAILLGLLAVVTPSLRQLGDLHPAVVTLVWAAPLSFVWISLEAGLCEEFLFRACLQTRLETVTRLPVAAILVTSTIFALAHAPGLFLRGGPGVDGWSTDPWQVAAFTIATLSPVSILFGVLWTRTRSLLLCVLLHGTIDFLPHLPEFVQMWG